MPSLPTWNTSPLGSSTGAAEPRSWSVSLSDFQVTGVKLSSSDIVGLSLRTLSELSGVDPVAALPVETHTLPWASMTGAAPPIHTAPWLSPGRSATVKVEGVEPSSGAETTSPW